MIQYGMEITHCEFQDGRWKIEMANGSTNEADFVIAATGVLHHPAYPDIEGLFANASSPQSVAIQDACEANLEFDVLIFAMGFRVDRFMRPMNVIGRMGVALDDAWKKGPYA